MLRVENISWSIQGRAILQNIALELTAREFVGLIGPNGSGKSSLLRCLYRVYKPTTGQITFNGKNLWHLSPRKLAKQVAVVLQETSTDFDFTVEEVVAMGRAPHQGMFERESHRDRHIIQEAFAQVGLADLAERHFRSLSGGEKQRVLVARALVQQPQLLILDEPTNHLDIRYQLELMELVKGLKIPCIAAIHDLNLAAAYCDRLIVLEAGQVVAAGTPTEILTPNLIERVYGVKAEIHRHSRTGTPYLIWWC